LPEPSDGIVVSDVCHGFGGHAVLDRVSLRVAAHELVCVVGQSGCGKTTLLRIIAGLLEADEGHVSIAGRTISGPGSSVAMVFQHFGLFPWKTVRANVAYGLVNRGIRDPERVDRVLRTVGLDDAANRYPRQLSGGMQQRVGLARALAVEPEVLLLDEPFGSLDAITREQLQKELLRIWERNPAVSGLFVTHDIDEALLLGDRVLVLSPRPGSITAEIEVAFDRPRSVSAVRADTTYSDLRASIWASLQPGHPVARVG
jgi:NitT/TauT family transport system ATP-binding protein